MHQNHILEKQEILSYIYLDLIINILNVKFMSLIQKFQLKKTSFNV